jgi:Skp family chaperone for outer membrane proteins
MTTRKMLGAALVVALSTAGAASAQTAPAAAPRLGGPLIPGLCILGRDALFANSKVGVAANARLKALTDQVQAELDRERVAIETDAKALDAQAATLKPDDLKTRRSALAARMTALQRKAAQRSSELEATRVKATERLGAEAEPVVAQVYKTRNCGALISREAMMGANPDMDITLAAIQALDARITTISFEREVAPAQATQRR